MQAIFRASTSRQTYNRGFIRWRLVLENEIIPKNTGGCVFLPGQQVRKNPHFYTFQPNGKCENVEWIMMNLIDLSCFAALSHVYFSTLFDALHSFLNNF